MKIVKIAPYFLAFCFVLGLPATTLAQTYPEEDILSDPPIPRPDTGGPMTNEERYRAEESYRREQWMRDQIAEARRRAAHEAQQAEARRASECNSRRRAASFSRSQCILDALSTFDSSLNACPPETVVGTALPGGIVSSQTGPQGACVLIAESAREVRKQSCEVDYEAALTVMPQHCF